MGVEFHAQLKTGLCPASVGLINPSRRVVLLLLIVPNGASRRSRQCLMAGDLLQPVALDHSVAQQLVFVLWCLTVC